MKTINIKGKEYVPVHERVLYFISEEKYKGWAIITEILEVSQDHVLIKASVMNDKREVISTGHAYELQSSSFINKTSHVENAETSAVGRALGLLGIGIENSFASANEVANAQKQQSDPSTELPWLSELTKNKFIDKIRSADYGDLQSPEECLDALKKKYRIRKAYLQEIQDEINDPFNKGFIDEKK